MSWLLFCTFRYSLGRLSYASGLTCGLMRRYQEFLTAEERSQIVREIREHLRRNTYDDGFKDIVRDWQSLADDLDPELE